MAVDSYIELFTTLYGWLLYNVIWDVMVETGLVFLPFLGIILDNFIEAFRQDEGEDSVSDSLRNLEVDLVIAFLVVMVAGNPFWALNASEVEFTPGPPLDLSATQEHPTINANDTAQQTYGSVAFIGHPTSVNIPVWWYGMMQISKGITHAVRMGVPSKKNYREYVKFVNTSRIGDKHLTEETNDYFRDCFVPARSKYHNEKPESPAIDLLLTTHGRGDVEFIGSRVLQLLYYSDMRSKEIVQDHPYQPLRDIEWDAAIDIVPTYGKPTCNKWWNGDLGVLGLKQRLIDDMSEWYDLVAIYDPFSDTSIAQDAFLHAHLSRDKSVGMWTPRDYDHAYDNVYALQGAGWSAVDRFVKDFLGWVILAILNFMFSFFLDLYLKAGHMIQAILLMGIYGLLPFAVIVSRYRLGILMSGAFLIFIINFWTALWSWAAFFDMALMESLYPLSGEMSFWTMSVGNEQKEFILQFLAGMMYILFPTILSIMLAMAGFNFGRSIDGMTSSITSKIQGAQNKLKTPKMPKKPKTKP